LDRTGYVCLGNHYLQFVFSSVVLFSQFIHSLNRQLLDKFRYFASFIDFECALLFLTVERTNGPNLWPKWMKCPLERQSLWKGESVKLGSQWLGGRVGDGDATTFTHVCSRWRRPRTNQLFTSDARSMCTIRQGTSFNSEQNQ